MFRIKKLSVLVILILGIGLFNSCQQEGCTDPKANNFSYEAQKEDGSCDYGGCMDKDALNYNPDAKEDNGTCKYNGGVKFITTRSSLNTSNVFISVEINGGYIGSLSRKCTDPLPNCETTCAHLNFTDQAEGSYSMRFFEIKQYSSTSKDTLFTSQPLAITVTGGTCTVYKID